MKRICAWCKKEIGSSSIFDGIGDLPDTHGICGDCFRNILSSGAESLRSYLNRFREPVFLVNSEGRIVTGNSAGFSLLKKKPEEVDGELPGNAFECKYAYLPGGCGNTIHCRTCTIRNTITDTMKSGMSNIRIPAYPDLHHSTGENQIRFLITTEKIGESVFLRIDDVAEENVSKQDSPTDN